MTTITVDTDGQKDPIFIARLLYVLDFIQNHACAPDDVTFVIDDVRNESKVIQYSDKGGPLQIVPQKVFFTRSQILLSQPKEIELNIQNYLVKVFANNGGSEFIPFDIFETIFFHISRYEEWFLEERLLDHHGTLASHHQYLVKNNLQQIPLVDILVCYFFEKLRLSPKLIATTITMSHDIDVIQKYPSFYKFLRGYGHILLHQSNKFVNLVKHTQTYLNILFNKQKDPYDTFDWLILKSSANVTDKTIYWLTGGKTKYEGFFSINDPKVKKYIQIAKNSGYTIGLHPSYDTITDQKMMTEELQILTSITSLNIKYIRQHFLRFDIRHTGFILDELDIKNDSSLGFRDKIGFRCGTGFPYQLYNFKKECAFKFKEIPMIIMDIAAMRESQWNSQQFVQLITNFLETNKANTHITFNFHNSFFDPVLIDIEYIKKWYLATFN